MFHGKELRMWFEMEIERNDSDAGRLMMDTS